MQSSACSGGGEASIGTFDIVFIKLTETYTWADWWHDGYGYYTVNSGGKCWENPKTIANTKWYVESCYGDLDADYDSAYAVTNNLSYNYNFLDDDQYTWVNQQASVYHFNGSAGVYDISVKTQGR